MHIRLRYFIAALALFFGLFVAIVIMTSTDNIFIFEGVVGPTDITVMKTRPPTSWKAYATGGSSRLSILLTDERSAWLGLAHGLKAAGIPFSLTTDYKEALKHKVIWVYPMISGSVLEPAALQALAKVPRNGGTLIGSMVLGGGLQEVFGFAEAVPSRKRFEATIKEGGFNALLPSEAKISLGNSTDDSDAIGTYAYTNPRETPIAVYDDGGAAMIHRKIGTGNAYALGIDIGALLLKGHNNREEGYARSYVNEYEPMLDVLMRLVRGIYQKADDRAVFLSPVPEGKDLAVIISHDIDYTRSLINAVEYARLERSLGVPATYFMQAKYMKDWNDDIILNKKAPALLQEIKGMGMELASHGVSHSLVFHDFPLGDGREQYPDYRPFVKDAATTLSGSILGELRVSRFLIEQLAEVRSIVSFRPGHLTNPYALPQALEATGYSFSSSVTANNSLTHLPFQLNHDRDVTTELPVYEFPVTIEDESLPPLGDRLPQSVALAKKISRDGGVYMVLIHPDILGHKLEFEREFINAVKSFSWFGTLSDYGTWWQARDVVAVDSQWHKDHLIVRLHAPKPLDGLTLHIPSGMTFDPQSNPNIEAKIVGDKMILGQLHGTLDIQLSRHTAQTKNP